MPVLPLIVYLIYVVVAVPAAAVAAFAVYAVVIPGSYLLALTRVLGTRPAWLPEPRRAPKLPAPIPRYRSISTGRRRPTLARPSGSRTTAPGAAGIPGPGRSSAPSAGTRPC